MASGSRSSVEKNLNEQTLELGQVSLTEKQAAQLGLPSHSGVIPAKHGESELGVRWDSAARRLSGEEFGDTLQLHGEIGGMLRLSPLAEGLELEVVPASATNMSMRNKAARAETRVAAKTTRVDRQLREERFRIRSSDEFTWHQNVGFHKETLDRFVENITNGGWDEPSKYALRLKGERLSAVNDFEELMAIDLAHVDHMPHQEAAAIAALTKMRGRAILADEVGLGKTIEAGFVLKELTLRGRAQRVLICCPATLRDQWQEELKEKFDEEFEVIASSSQGFEGDKLIMSTVLARNNRKRLFERDWDLVILDEAHKNIGGPATRELFKGLNSRYMLFLTATPVSNKLDELYFLVDLLRPGTFTSLRDFKDTFVDREDPRTPRDPAALRRLVSDVMIRTTRSQAGLDNVARIARDIPVTMSDSESKLYAVCTEVLRSVMDDSADHLRRRHLAHRLTCSPRALGQTAHKMSQTHPNLRVREILKEIAELSIDLGPSNRQQTFLRLVSEWIEDPGKGKVLVFTQHTDTLEDLMRVLDDAGISSVPFHGQLSRKRKQASIDAFRNDTPVMVSTDAGAEGLNLQFANCVVNYDLPWNPMRIEQRIGRVHRVTQTRDVYVANLFTLGTIVERVYELLRDKLKMFELLFGQITTVLGELDVDGKGESFEKQVFDAYLSSDDELMDSKFEELGLRVEEAYNSAEGAIQTGGHLSNWYADHRDQIPEGGATELRPELRESARNRQQSVVDFATEFLDSIDAEITYRDDMDDSTVFLTAEIPVDQREVLGGREELHLAFTADGLNRHPDAELCAVGSEVFEELVFALRDEGDLLARIPNYDIPQESWLPAVEGLEFVRREVLGPSEWGAEATWRVRIDGGEGGESIVQCRTGAEHIASEIDVPVLDGGESLPETIPAPPEVVDRLVSGAIADLQAMAGEEADRVHAAHREEQDRQKKALLAQISQYEDQMQSTSSRNIYYERESQVANLQAAKRQVMESVAAPVEIQADLLAVDVVGSWRCDFEETWKTADGEEFSIASTWRIGDSAIPEYVTTNGEKISTLARCDDGHLVDASNTTCCPTCTTLYCSICPSSGRFSVCRICQIQVCGSCCPTPNFALCSGCATPNLDNVEIAGGVRWNLGNGAVIDLFPRRAVFTDGLGASKEVLHDAELSAPKIRRLHDLLSAHGLPIDAGLQLQGEAPLGLSLDDSALLLSQERTVDFETTGDSDSSVDPAALALVVTDGATDETTPKVSGALAGVLAGLRSRTKFPKSQALLVRPFVKTTWLAFDEDALNRVVCVEKPLSEPEMTRVPVEMQESHGEGSTVLTGSFPEGSLTIERLNNSFIYRVSVGEEIQVRFVPASPGVTSSSEQAWLAFASAELGQPVASVQLGGPIASPAVFAVASNADLESRKVSTVWRKAGMGDGVEIPTSGQAEMLGLSGTNVPPVASTTAGHHRFLLSRTGAVSPSVLVPMTNIVDTWKGDNRPEVSYVVDPQQVAAPIDLDPENTDLSFFIDENSHCVAPAAASTCPLCSRVHCSDCGDAGQLSGCIDCGTTACGVCREDVHALDDQRLCEVCADQSCGGCGRVVTMITCGVCSGPACASCSKEEICNTCHSLREAPTVEPDRVPDWMLPGRCEVRMVSDQRKTVSTIQGLHRREVSITRDGQTSWLSLSDHTDAEHRLLRLSKGADASFVYDVRSGFGEDEVGKLILFEEKFMTVGLTETDAVRASVELARSIRLEEMPADGKVASSLVRALGLREQPVPTQATDDLRLLSNVLFPDENESDSGINLVLTGQTSIDKYVVDKDGLRRSFGPDESPDTQLAAWVPGSGNLADSIAELQPVPDSVKSASAGEMDVALLRYSSDVLLLSQFRSSYGFQRLSHGGGFPDGAILSQKLGEPRSSRIARFLHPNDIGHLELSNATLESRSFEPTVYSTSADFSGDNTKAAKELWAQGTTPSLPAEIAADGVNEEVAQSLVELARGEDFSLEPPVELGVRVSERWSTPLGPVDLVHELSVDSPNALLTVSDSEEPVASAVIDRSGHYLARVETCNYCSTQTCSSCESPCQPCAICEESVCGRCVETAEPHLCLACSRLETIGRFERRRVARGSDTALQGQDVRHGVVVTATNEKYSVQVTWKNGADRSHELFPSPEVAAFLNGLTGKQFFTARVPRKQSVGSATGRSARVTAVWEEPRISLSQPVGPIGYVACHQNRQWRTVGSFKSLDGALFGSNGAKKLLRSDTQFRRDRVASYGEAHYVLVDFNGGAIITDGDDFVVCQPAEIASHDMKGLREVFDSKTKTTFERDSFSE